MVRGGRTCQIFNRHDLLFEYDYDEDHMRNLYLMLFQSRYKFQTFIDSFNRGDFGVEMLNGRTPPEFSGEGNAFTAP